MDAERFAAYAFYDGDTISKLALINLQPYYANSTSDFTVSLDISGVVADSSCEQASLKRLTAPYVDSKDAADVTWAGQSFVNGTASGELMVESIRQDGVVQVRGSEAVLVSFA